MQYKTALHEIQIKCYIKFCNGEPLYKGLEHYLNCTYILLKLRLYLLFLIFIHTFIKFYSPLLGLGRFFSSLILFTVGMTPWTECQPVARPLPTHRTTQTQNKHTKYRHQYLDWDSSPRSNCSWRRRQSIP
jgi:hypothetical protein